MSRARTMYSTYRRYRAYGAAAGTGLALGGYAKKAYKATRKQPPKTIRKTTRKPFPKKVGQQIKELKRLTESDMGLHIYRHLATTIRSSAAAQMNIQALTGMNLASIEASLAGLRYYNPSAPSALVTADGTTGSYQKDFLIEKMYSRYTARNNYQVPCKLTMYIVRPKDATTIGPGTAFTNGMADVGNPYIQSPGIFLTDSTQFNDLWTIENSKSKVLYPGQEMVLSYSPKPFQYDPSTFDSHTATYNKAFRSYTLVTRVEGVLGHDTTLGEYTNLAAAVDLEEYRLFHIKYSAGADIKTIVVNDVRDTGFTNSGVCSNNPITNNQAYSVS